MAYLSSRYDPVFRVGQGFPVAFEADNIGFRFAVYEIRFQRLAAVDTGPGGFGGVWLFHFSIPPMGGAEVAPPGL